MGAYQYLLAPMVVSAVLTALVLSLIHIFTLKNLDGGVLAMLALHG